jgi:hypothetical protein
MKKSIYLLAFTILFTSAAIAQEKDNTLTKKEVKDGWKLLFDGKTTDSWMNYKTGTFPTGGWVVKDGLLTITPGSKGGDIVTKDKFKSFEFSVDFKYTPGANSGIKYFIDTERDGGKMASIGCEYQVLDDKLHPDAKAGINGNRKLSSLYDLIPAKNAKDNGPNQWNNAKIVVNGNHVQHWLNGQITVEYDRGSDEWKKAVASSKFKNQAGFGEVEAGRLLLQDHGNEVAYKNIKIKALK